MADKKLSETESLNYTTEVPVYVAVVKYSDNTEQAITENRKIPLSQFAKDSSTLHNTGNETFTGTKTGQGINIPIALKRYNTYTEIQTQKSDGTRTGGFRNIQETNSTVNQTLMYVADGSSYKGSITLNYDSSNNEVWATLPKVASPLKLKKVDNANEGGEIQFEGGGTEPNASKDIKLDRNYGAIRIFGEDSNGTVRVPFNASIQNNAVDITSLYMSNQCYLQKNATDVRFVAKDTGYVQGNTVSVNRYSGIRMFDKNNVEMGTVFTQYQTDGNVTTRLFVKTPTAGATTNNTMGIGAKPDGTFWTFAPTPSSATDNSTKIATTNFITNKLHYNAVMGGRVFDTLFTGPIATGNITLAHPYTDYDALIVVGGDDSSNGISTNYITQAELNLRRSYNKVWALFIRAGVYWFCTAASTTTSFVVSSENCTIQAIYGIKY